MSLPLCHGVSQVSAIVPATVPAVATRFPGASGAVAWRLFKTGKSVKDAVSLFAASFSGFDPGFV